MDVGLNDAGAHGIDPNTFCCHFFRQAHGESVDGTLAGGVVHIVTGATQTRGGAGDVDDGAASTAVARAHAFDRFPGAQETAQHVDVEHALESCHAHLIDTLCHVHHTGVVDQCAESPQPGVDGFEHRHHFRRHRHVRLQRDGIAAARANLPHN